MTETPAPERLVADLVSLLTVQEDGADHYIGQPQTGGVGRVFGGQVIAQALQSAQLAAPDGMVAHSLHAYFLRGGREGPAIDYTIARDFDGRSFANRRVVAAQEGTPILNLTASFQMAEDGLAHQDCVMPDVAQPEDLTPDMVLRQKFADAMPDMPAPQRALMLRPRPIETRTVDRLHWMNSEPRAPLAHSWFRTAAPLPDDANMHRAIIAYASDYTLLGTSALPHGLSWMRGELIGASLDHTIWFHAPARADDWLLYVTDSPWSGGGRGFNRGSIYSRDGTLVASVAQEGMMRERRTDKA
ncbi:acyl-CoA thioesterase II [Altererythrobacter confluentis]|uniref:Acyl-CoA thioesterase 2 n=1 Tax=Allopontixanthobacter confluentis TaxID=1849021 RepID=A0A6L7GDL9_9SPHN|nr:acyl-CoA thioesterase II [Allopontixanthobacter confluentis]MXP13680.1 acyl-CoA thioesterase II [Allopontixanthobacter confluentis]